MIKVNLLPKTARTAGERDWRLLAGGVAGGLVVLVMLFTWWSVSSQARSLRGEIASMQAELKQLEVVAKQVDQFKKEKKLLEARLKVMQQLLASQSVPVHLLQALSEQLTDELWLSSVSKAGTRLTIRGYSFTDFGIANFMTRLSGTAPLLQDVELVVSEQAEVEKTTVKKFEIICKLIG
ncbi:MAG: PilN domain-containing protein [Candidatus Methylomirabilales bacterium]